MMNTALVKTARMICDMAKDFSGSKFVNWTIRVRCLKAVRTKSMDGLCDPIKYVTIDSDFESVEYTMEPEKVEVRLKELGLYQLVERNSTNVSLRFKEMLDAQLIGSFGYAEVEAEMRKRAIEAVETLSMDPLMEGIDMEWRNGCCIMTSEKVIEKLKEKGIWQLVQSEIRILKGE